ncbi:MAG: hypothetical protein SynsKO_33680 [Synoicihabitans sp.]
MFPFFVLLALATVASAKTRLLIDADTANEVDDAFAIVRALIEPSFEIVGLNSTQWQVSHYATPETLMDSQRLNEAILTYMDRRDIPAPYGAYRRLHDWGNKAQPSQAALHIIKEAHKTPTGEKLTVAVLGANTNLASALLIDPSIAPKLDVILLGTTYNPETKIWTKRDFNCVMDIQAIEVVLSADALDLTIIPVNVAAKMKFGIDEMKAELAGRNHALDFLHQIWMEHKDGSRIQRTIWDLSVITCLIDPTFGTVETVEAPPENGRRPVKVYTDLDGAGIRAEFYQKLREYFAADYR